MIDGSIEYLFAILSLIKKHKKFIASFFCGERNKTFLLLKGAFTIYQIKLNRKRIFLLTFVKKNTDFVQILFTFFSNS